MDGGSIVGLVGGALAEAGKTLVAEITKEYYGSRRDLHRAEAKSAVIEIVEGRGAAFLVNLESRLHSLESSHEETLKIIRERLREPSFKVAFDNALSSAFQTDDKSRLEVLAELILARILEAEDARLSLVLQRALEAVSFLDRGQVLGLGLAFMVHEVLPTPPAGLSREVDWWTWWDAMLGQLLRAGARWDRQDGAHLIACSCAFQVNGQAPHLEGLLKATADHHDPENVQVKAAQRFLSQNTGEFDELARELTAVCGSRRLMGFKLTSVGRAIGFLAANTVVPTFPYRFSDYFGEEREPASPPASAVYRSGDDSDLIKCTPVYIDSDGGLRRACANQDSSTDVFGLILSHRIAPHDEGEVITEGRLFASALDWDAVTGDVGGLRPGKRYFLDPVEPGRLTAQPPAISNTFVAPIGTAVNQTELLVRIESVVGL